MNKSDVFLSNLTSRMKGNMFTLEFAASGPWPIAILSRAEDDPDVWEVHVTGIVGAEPDEVYSYGRNLSEAVESANEAVALALDLPEGDTGPELMFSMDGYDHELPSMQVARACRTFLDAEIAGSMRSMAYEFVHTEGLTHGDAAKLLGVKRQRVSKLLSEA